VCEKGPFRGPRRGVGAPGALAIQEVG
jgi:hypothetical protein